MARSSKTDPLRNFRFLVDIPKGLGPGGAPLLAKAGFLSVGGLAAQTEAILYREGGYNTTPRKLPGQTNFTDITLTRGLIVNDEDNGAVASWAWMKELFSFQDASGQAAATPQFRTDITIKVLDHPVTVGEVGGTGRSSQNDSHGLARAVFKVYNAWITSIAYSDLDAGSNAVAVEQIRLAHEGIDARFSKGPGEPAPF